MYQKHNPDPVARGWKVWDTDKLQQEGSAERTAGPSFVPVNENESTGECERLAIRSAKAFAKYGETSSIGEMSGSDYLAALSACVRLVWKLKSCPAAVQDEKEPADVSAPQDAMAVIDVPEGYLLRIKTPLLYSGKYSGAYLSANFIDDAIKKYQEKNGPLTVPGHAPLVMVFERYVTKNMNKICDNDNYEQRRVTNTIANALGVSDAFDSMAFFYTTKRTRAENAFSVVSLLTRDQYAAHCRDFI
jgi:hypothetical protein